MATARRTRGEIEDAKGVPPDAVSFLWKLRNKIVHVTVSDPENRAETLVEFELPVSDSIVSAVDGYLRSQAKRSSGEPNARVAAALEEAERIEPRFKSAEELFDALEKEGQG